MLFSLAFNRVWAASSVTGLNCMITEPSVTLKESICPIDMAAIEISALEEPKLSITLCSICVQPGMLILRSKGRFCTSPKKNPMVLKKKVQFKYILKLPF